MMRSPRFGMALGLLLVGMAAVDCDAQSRSRAKNARPSEAARTTSGFSAEWIGQGREDRVGSGPSVGPDGLADTKIVLKGITSEAAIVGVIIKSSGGVEWNTGVNPDAKPSAELVRRQDPAVADLFLQPIRDIKGQTLSIALHYANAKVVTARLTAGKFDPKLAIPRPKLASPSVLTLGSRWIGQDGTNMVGPGDVRVTIDGLPRVPVAAAALSGASGGLWVARLNDRIPFETGPDPIPLSFVRGADPTRADLRFPPLRDESGTNMTLRLLFEDGRTAIASIPGGKCDPGLRAAVLPANSSVNAKPGDDLHALAKVHGAIKLAPGRYMLDRPLILDKPIAIRGEPASTLVFSQKASDPTWAAAIKVQSGHTTMEGFSVRFATPIRWTPGVTGGPAVIGTTDNTDPGPGDLKADLNFRNLDLEGPPASTAWEETPRLLRMGRAVCGVIEGNTLKGGSIEVENGPWRIVGNRHIGTPENTFCFAVVATHHSHDILVKDNVIEPARGVKSKTWRFLVLTQGGSDDVVEGNTVVNVGPRNDDKIPPDNAPELILTESYALHFEGRLAGASPDGRVVAVSIVQGDPVRAGDALAILSGPSAGKWVRIAQPLSPTTFLLAEPLPPGSSDAAVSIATGFTNETFRANTIDARGSGGIGCLVLVGNHFGLIVSENHFLGGRDSFHIKAAPSQSPMEWGWSHAPIMGATIERNILEDSTRGGVLGVERSPHIKSSLGRVYSSVTLRGNTIRHTRHAGRDRPAAFTIGDTGCLDPGEVLIVEEGNAAEGGAELKAVAARINGKDHRNRGFPLPAARTEASGSKTERPRR